MMTNVCVFLRLTRYYKNYVKGYFGVGIPLFDLTKKDSTFKCNSNCQSLFDQLKVALVTTPILVKLDFTKAFILDVDWSTRSVGAILSQKEGRWERIIAYVCKGLFRVQKQFHPKEGECYALVQGIMHFWQYLYQNHFTFHTDHKPLEWLTTMSNAYGWRGRWINRLQDLSFKIVYIVSLGTPTQMHLTKILWRLMMNRRI